MHIKNRSNDNVFFLMENVFKSCHMQIISCKDKLFINKRKILNIKIPSRQLSRWDHSTYLTVNNVVLLFMLLAPIIKSNCPGSNTSFKFAS